MTPEQGRAFEVDDVDFNFAYESGQMLEGTVRFDRLPWDLGEPQPAIIELERAGGFRGEVLDAGCGYGDNALFLAERGYRVTGVDGAFAAIEQARQRAEASANHPEFAVADVTSMNGFGQQFDTVLDSALYHCLPERQRRSYSAALHRVSKPGARLHVFCFADEGRGTFPLPMCVSKDELRANLSEHWKIGSIEVAYYATSFTREDSSDFDDSLAALGITVDESNLLYDEHGRLRLAVWHLLAERR